ncbi:carbonic anhydrase [Methanocella sp. CWC-04]|uniref:carbonic anhydrase n=1 Tax=Methanooceanicella nereidis TaxID=2052831 RepID=A0AAP2RCI6_9EURY|nr:carbonic anhydrase [Methanocella sp. CWC-04]MCD1293560.1 carbonic anhydrase [Methanocella sp. CWC-04]
MAKKGINILLDKLEHNDVYAQKATVSGKYDEMMESQKPDVTLVTCSDSRVHERALDEKIGKIFSVKNIGNRVEPNLGSILYGACQLHTPLLMILGHTGCGAIHSSIRDMADKHHRVRKSLAFFKPAVDDVDSILDKKGGITKYIRDHNITTAKSVSDITFFETLLTEANVDRQIDTLLDEGHIRKLISSEKLMVIGAIYDFKDIYSTNRGSIFITNVNGKSDVADICKMDILGEYKDFVSGRVKRFLFYK